MNGTVSNSDQWEACPAGELGRVVRHLKTRRRDKAIAKVIGTTCALLILVLSGGLIVQQVWDPARPNFGNIACGEVRSNLPDYIVGKLDKQLASQIRTHLARCPECGPMYEKMMSSQMGTAQHNCDHLPSCLCRSCIQRSAVAMLDARYP